ncbi:MAG: YfhO family protein [Clostridiales bacterium]|nr:YfhO family protein [Clostridiales bacterium]
MENQGIENAPAPALAGRRSIRDRIFEGSFLVRVLCFAFPFLTVVTVFSILGIFPVGDRTILTVDLYHQYCPFLYELKQKILDGGSLFYSWNCGLGNEYYAAFANYSASPLNIFVLLFSYKAIPVFIAFITAVRAGLASLFMSFLLSDTDDRRCDLITVVFGSSYALCGWFFTDFWNIMWCDAFVMLPLIVLGLRKLMKEGKYLLYTLSLAVCIASNYYAGYFICIFLVLLAPVLCITMFNVTKDETDPDRLCVRKVLTCAGRFALASLIAGLMAAFIVIPTYLILQHSSATGDEFVKDFNLTGNLFDFMGRLLVAANPNIRDGMANVASGTVPVLMLPLFFMAPKESGITKRHKFGYAFLLIFMYLSFTNRTLNFIWHGFHFPNQIPYRQSFIMCFLIITVAHMTVRILRTIPPSILTAVLTGEFIFLVLFEKFGEGNEGYTQIGLSLLFLLIQGSVLCAVRRGRNRSFSFYEILLMSTMMVEMFFTVLVAMATVRGNEGFTGYEFYGKNREIIKTHTEEIEGTEGHRSFERTEVYPNNICDIQSVYDIKGMSIFSSTARESFVKYMRNFGFHNNGINGLRNAGLTRVTATLLGIRNLATIENTKTVPAIFDLEWSDGEVLFYGNPDALSVGYIVSDEILDYEPDFGMTDNFAKTNLLVRSMGVDKDVYTPIQTIHDSTENAVYSGVVGNTASYGITDPNSPASITVRINNAPEDADIYIRFDSTKGGNVTIDREGDESITFEIRSYQTICLGKFDGREIKAKVTYQTPPSGSIRLNSYALDKEGYDAMVSRLSRSQLDVSYYNDTTIAGKIDVKEEGFLLLTVPYTEGFTLTVDGKREELVSVQDALCGVHLTKGHHEIVLKYEPQGFGTGMWLTLGGAVSLAGIVTLQAVRRKKDVPEAITPVQEQS